MATALETSSEQKSPSTPANLLAASVAGAVYVLAAVAIVIYAVPHFFRQVAGSTSDNLTASILLLGFEVAAFVGLVFLGRILAGSSPPKGLRGGIFLVISLLFTVSFVVRAIGLNLNGMPGVVVTVAIGLALIVLSIRLLSSARGERWMVGLEHSGMFSTSTYKSMLGQRVRRLTILGILLIGGSGVYTMWSHATLPQGDWVLNLPFTDATVTLLPTVRFTAPLLLLALTGWFAWRVTNMPTFAEFLIATEAEMNKVSWSTRRQLTQDTIVVLLTTFLMTAFLFSVDVFWGWSLSQVGVLPGKADIKPKAQLNEAPKW